MKDSVQLFSGYIQALRMSGERVCISRWDAKERDAKVLAAVNVLREETSTEEEKRKSLETLWLHSCFYIIKELKRSNLPKPLFDDALQNAYLLLASKAHKFNPAYNEKYPTTFAGFLTRSCTISNATQKAIISDQMVRDTRAVRQRLLENLDEEAITTTEYREYMEYEHPNKVAASAEKDVYNRELAKILESIFSTEGLLNKWEKTAILGKFGLMGHRQMTLVELQDNFASQDKTVTTARISQIQKEALEKLKDYLKEKGIDSINLM